MKVIHCVVGEKMRNPEKYKEQSKNRLPFWKSPCRHFGERRRLFRHGPASRRLTSGPPAADENISTRRVHGLHFAVAPGGELHTPRARLAARVSTSSSQCVCPSSPISVPLAEGKAPRFDSPSKFRLVLQFCERLPHFLLASLTHHPVRASFFFFFNNSPKSRFSRAWLPWNQRRSFCTHLMV